MRTVFFTAAIILSLCSVVHADDAEYLRVLLSQPNTCSTVSGSFVANAPIVMNRTASIVSLRGLEIVFRDAGDNALSSFCFKVEGDRPELVSASESVVRGSDVTHAGTHPGDMICMFNPALGSYSTHRPNYHAGEFATVASTGKIAGSWLASYTGCQLYRYAAPATGSMQGVTIRYEGSLAPTVLVVNRAKDYLLRDVRLSGSPSSLCHVTQSLGVVVDHCRFEQLFPDTVANGYNYGLVIANSQEVRVTNSTMIAVRHAITTGGASYAVGVPVPTNRLISVSNCDLYSTFNVAAFDTHGNIDQWSLRNSRVHGGVDVGGNNGVVDGCDIIARNESQAGVAVYATEWSGCDHAITNNTIQAFTTASYNERAAIYLHINAPTTTGGTTTISGNRVLVTGSIGTVRGMMVNNSGSAQRWRVNYTGNVMTATTPATSMIKFSRVAAAGKFLSTFQDTGNTLTGGVVTRNAALDFDP